MEQDITYTVSEAARITREYRAGEWTDREDESGAGGFWDLAGEIAARGVPDTFVEEHQTEQAREIEERQEIIYAALHGVLDAVK